MMPAVPRICVLSVDFPSADGGIAVFAAEVARGLAARGYPTTVLAGSADAVGDREIDASLPYPVFRFPRGRNKALNLLYRLRALALCVHRTHPDLVLATDWYGAGTVVWLLAGPLGLRYAVAAHGNEVLRCRRSTILSAICRKVMARAIGVIAVSRYTRDLVTQIIDPRLTPSFIPCGVSPGDLPGTSNKARLREELGLGERPIVLSLGRLVRRKGHDMILQALPEVLRRVPEVMWLIAGKGEYEATLRHEVERLGLQDHVMFLGYVDPAEKGAFYAMCDVYALVSRTIEDESDVEGFGITYLEAARAGRPVVAGRSGGVSDAVVDQETGILVDPESPNEIAAALTRLLAHPDEARRLGEAGRRRVLAELTWEHTVDRLIAALSLGQPDRSAAAARDHAEPGSAV